MEWVAKTRKQILEKAGQFEVSYEFALAQRVDYLQLLISTEKVKVKELSCELAVCNGDMNRAFLKSSISEAKDKVEKFEKEIKRLLNPVVSVGGITDEMIEEAKHYPVDLLIEFNRGRCKAFCHDSDSFSMSHNKKANRAHCFVCNRSFNPIDILIERDGLSFVDSVLQLVTSRAA